MSKYERKKRTGWVFHHENTAMLEAMDAEDCKAIIIALTKYSRDLSEGEDAFLDVSCVPSSIGKAFCRMAAERIIQEADSFTQKCNQNQKNRKEVQTVVDDGQRSSTVVDDGQRSSPLVDQSPISNEVSNKVSNEVGEVKREVASPADDDFDLSEQIAAHQRADELIRRYRLPDSDPTREALLEDAEKYGFDRLEDVLKQAALSNNRQGDFCELLPFCA